MNSPTIKGRSLKDTLLLVGSSQAFTKRVILWTLPVGLFVAVFYDGNRFGTSRLGWLAVGLIAHAVATLVMFLLRQVMLPKGSYEPAPTRTIVIFILGSSTRSAVIGALTFQWNLAPSTLMEYRIFAGALIGTLTLCVVAVVAAVVKEHATTQALLNIEYLALEDAKQNAQNSIDSQRIEIQKILVESVEPALTEIAKNLQEAATSGSTSLKDSADKITDFIDDELRPLTKSLHRREVVEIPEAASVKEKPSLAAIPALITLRKVTSPLAIYLILVGPSTTGLYPYQGLMSLPLVIAVLSPMFLIQIAMLELPIAKREIPGRLGLLILTILFAISLVPAIFTAQLLNIEIIQQFNLAPTLIIGTTLAGLMVTYGFIIDQERIKYEIELLEANQALNLELNRTAQQVWLLRQRAAQILHGSVQSSLTAANMRIRSARQIDDELLKKVQEDVERASISISNFGAAEIALQDSLTEIVDLWHGVCEVGFKYSSEFIEKVSRDAVTAHCVNEIVKECVSNAIRHGHAKQVLVEISDPQDGSLVIAVTNNGDELLSDQRGVGSQMLDEITMSWSREKSVSGVRVVAKVAANSLS